MNELLFFSHIGVVICLSLFFSKLGKEALITLTVLNSIFANFFVLKQTLLFGWNVTCSDVFAIGGVFSLNLLQEKHGKAFAAKAIFISFFSLLFFAVMSQIHLLYSPSPQDTADAHYQTLLSPAPRLLFASLIAFGATQSLDYRFFGWMKSRFPQLSWKWRLSFSLITSQLLDTILFSFLGLYGLVDSVLPIILFSFLVKLVILSCITLLSRAPLKQEEPSL